MFNYKQLIADCLQSKDVQTGRNGLTQSVFGKQLEFQPAIAFPVVTGRQIFYKGVMGELAALLKGPSNVSDFHEEGCHYWDKWADDDGSIRLAYGNAWRDFNGIDQLDYLIKQLKENPHSRRHLITAWDPAGLDDLSSQCCHYAYQWRVSRDGLDMIWVQRSVDLMIGLPSDIVFAAAFLMLVANTVGMTANKLIMQLGDCHIYEEHSEKVIEYIKRPVFYLPKAELAVEATVFNFKPSMFELHNYVHADNIKFELKK